jgi:hypothetical protein
MRVRLRLERLERERRAKAPRPGCRECGGGGGDGPPQIRVAWEGEEVGPERCPGCGRRLVVEIAFDDAG